MRPAIRHVVVLTRSQDADAERRGTTVEALRRDVGGMASLVLAVIAEHVRPYLAVRSAVRYRV